MPSTSTSSSGSPSSVSGSRMPTSSTVLRGARPREDRDRRTRSVEPGRKACPSSPSVAAVGVAVLLRLRCSAPSGRVGVCRPGASAAESVGVGVLWGRCDASAAGRCRRRRRRRRPEDRRTGPSSPTRSNDEREHDDPRRATEMREPAELVDRPLMSAPTLPGRGRAASASRANGSGIDPEHDDPRRRLPRRRPRWVEGS